MKIWCVDHAGLSFNTYSELFFTKEEAQDRYDSLYAGPGSYRKMYQVSDIWGWCGRHFDEVILEDIQMQNNVVNNVQTFKVLAEVFGVLSEMCVALDIPQSAVLASTWKSYLGIKGKARAEQKRNAQAWVVQTYGKKPTQDECDAICIGMYGVNNSTSSGFDWS